MSRDYMSRDYMSRDYTLTPESRTAFGQLLCIFNFNEPGLLHRPSG